VKPSQWNVAVRTSVGDSRVTPKGRSMTRLTSDI
jgi:hypothetical protein